MRRSKSNRCWDKIFPKRGYSARVQAEIFAINLDQKLKHVQVFGTTYGKLDSLEVSISLKLCKLVVHSNGNAEQLFPFKIF